MRAVRLRRGLAVASRAVAASEDGAREGSAGRSGAEPETPPGVDWRPRRASRARRASQPPPAGEMSRARPGAVARSDRGRRASAVRRGGRARARRERKAAG